MIKSAKLAKNYKMTNVSKYTVIHSDKKKTYMLQVDHLSIKISYKLYKQLNLTSVRSTPEVHINTPKFIK